MAHLSQSTLPVLPYDSWKESNQTLHLMLQIVGKVRLALHPRLNHWWHVPFYVSSRGLSTGAMPANEGVAQFDFDLIDHVLRLTSSDGFSQQTPLYDTSIADFYAAVTQMLGLCGPSPSIRPIPFDEAKVRSSIPFTDDTSKRPYDRDAVHKFFVLLAAIEPVFQEFRGRFVGKSTPVHLFWHSMDMALTRFSGREAPPIPTADPVTRDAYSHEVISFGFWAGDPNTPFPAFYSYTAPEPNGLHNAPLEPADAQWFDVGSSHTAVYPYDAFRASSNPTAALLSFWESAYLGGARQAGWDVSAFRYAPAYE